MTVGSSLRDRGMLTPMPLRPWILPPGGGDPQWSLSTGLDLLAQLQDGVGGARRRHMNTSRISQSDQRASQRFELGSAAAFEIARHGRFHAWRRDLHHHVVPALTSSSKVSISARDSGRSRISPIGARHTAVMVAIGTRAHAFSHSVRRPSSATVTLAPAPRSASAAFSTLDVGGPSSAATVTKWNLLR